MRKILIGLSALGLLAFALPTPPANAEEGKLVIRTGDGGRHEDWRRHRHHKKIVVIKRRNHRDHDRM